MRPTCADPAIALAVKLTSKGPVLFRQRRVGRYGNPFTFLKFRSMYVGNDQAVHQEYVKGLIRGGNGRGSVEDEANGVVYKLTDDPRVTAVGKFLRKTSLDELPELWNVLKGEMSWVGPRPEALTLDQKYVPTSRTSRCAASSARE